MDTQRIEIYVEIWHDFDAQHLNALAPMNIICRYDYEIV